MFEFMVFVFLFIIGLIIVNSVTFIFSSKSLELVNILLVFVVNF